MHLINTGNCLCTQTRVFTQCSCGQGQPNVATLHPWKPGHALNYNLSSLSTHILGIHSKSTATMKTNQHCHNTLSVRRRGLLQPSDKRLPEGVDRNSSPPFSSLAYSRSIYVAISSSRIALYHHSPATEYQHVRLCSALTWRTFTILTNPLDSSSDYQNGWALYNTI